MRASLKRMLRPLYPFKSVAMKSADLRKAEMDRLYDLVMGGLASFSPGGFGDYYEFGVFSAATFIQAINAAKKWELSNMRFVAFDSFAGLPPPHDGQLAMSEGEFWRRVRANGIWVDRVRTVPGFYDQSLTKDLQADLATRPAAFINIDCDVHRSAKTVFEFIEPLVTDGTYIYLDDFHSTFRARNDWGTAISLFEHATRSRWKFYPVTNVGYWGHLFEVYDPTLQPNPTI